MMPEGKIQVVVKSRQVPVGTFLTTEPVFSASGVLLGYRSRTAVLFRKSIGEVNQKTVDEAQRFASNLGMGLEVVDGSRFGVLGRFLARLGIGGTRYPAIVVSPGQPNAASTSNTSPAVPGGC